MKQVFTTIGALALGASAAYYFDPQMGRRRRALVGDQINSASHEARDFLAAQSKRAGDHARGLAASARGALSFETPTDRQLNERVRSRLGRLVSHPHAIETDVADGRVILRGPILAREHPALIAAIWAMRGVRGIDNHLSLHETAGDVPGLQGKPHRRRRRLGPFASSAIPALAVAGAVGTGIGALRRDGADRTGPLSLAMGLLAFGLGNGARRMARDRHDESNQRESTAVESEGGRDMGPGSEAQQTPPHTGATSSTPSQAWH